MTEKKLTESLASEDTQSSEPSTSSPALELSAPSAPSALGALDAEGRAEYWASLALRHTPALGCRSHKVLLEHFGSAFAAVHSLDRWKETPIGEDKARHLKSDTWRETALHEWHLARSFPGSILLWTDPRYPEKLRQIPDPPCILYCQGDMSLLSNPSIAVVGTRRCSPEGLRVATLIVQGLAEAGVTIVSGMALGIDRVAHVASVYGVGSTIAVLGTGHGIPYPRRNLDIYKKVGEHGLIVSEFAPLTPASTHNFPIRNRIISALSFGVLVVEAALKSGSLITARLALEQDRTVYAIPGLVGMETALGCQELIRQGARPVFTAADILYDLSPQLKAALNEADRVSPEGKEPLPTIAREEDGALVDPSIRAKRQSPQDKVSADCKAGENTQESTPKPTLPPLQNELQEKIVSTLQEQTLDIDGLCQNLDLSASEVSAAVVMLEISGYIQRQKDAKYMALA